MGFVKMKSEENFININRLQKFNCAFYSISFNFQA